jgi:hypothetical protein
LVEAFSVKKETPAGLGRYPAGPKWRGRWGEAGEVKKDSSEKGKRWLAVDMLEKKKAKRENKKESFIHP